MKTELIKISSTKREIKIEIEPDEVKAVFNQVVKKYAKSAQIPGFRKGMAPVDVIRLRYKNEIHQDVIHEMLAPKVTEAIRKYDLNPLAEPDLHLENAEGLKLNGSMPVILQIQLEVMPEIPDLEYKGLETTRRVKPVAESELEAIIDEQRQQFSTLIPVEDRSAEAGDTVIVDLEGAFADLPDSDPIKADDLEIKLGDDLIEKSFTENLLGVIQDDMREFTVSYPADFSSPALAGNTINYKAKIKSVGTVELPELDDDWAQSLDQGFESMKDLREHLRADLEQMAYAEADNKARNDLIAKLIESHQFEVPAALVKMQAQNLLNNFGQDLAQKGVDLNTVEKDFIDMVYGQMLTQAERDVRGAMLLEKVADLEDAQVTSGEIVEEIERMADYYRTTPEEIRVSLTKQQGGEENIANSLRTRKAVEALVKHAKITDGEWVDEADSIAEAEIAEEEETKKSVKKPAKAKERKAQIKKKAEKEPKPDVKKKSAEKE